MTTIQDLFEKYTNINTQDMPYSAIIDDWLIAELSNAQMKPKLVLPRIAPRPMESMTLSSTKRKVEERQDEIAIKRQRNTDAARRSRLKKMIKMESLEKRVQDLESENHGLSTRVAVLESEKAGLESKDHSLEERIRALENQLAEAHKALTTNINKQ
jgi:predicted  nucleic acid-binding Zn-ribbon protein